MLIFPNILNRQSIINTEHCHDLENIVFLTNEVKEAFEEHKHEFLK